jgi:DNA mismatch repair protein MutS
MVEMREAATILRGATRRSLVILDEIGRGTSTYDGLAIAWSIAEHLNHAIRCRAMFATHYHELCELASTAAGVLNVNVSAREMGEEIVFLHRLAPGGANRSYGVAVARLAGLPPIVLARARALLGDLEEGRSLPSRSPGLPGTEAVAKAQLDLFSGSRPGGHDSAIIETLRMLDVDRIAPIDALVTLARLRAMLDEDG